MRIKVPSSPQNAGKRWLMNFIMTTLLGILMILVETNGNTPITMTTDSILLLKVHILMK